MAGVDIVSPSISSRINLTQGLTGLRLSQADGMATVETGRYHLEVDVSGIRIQDLQSQAWLECELPASADPLTLVLDDGTKVTLVWLTQDDATAPRLGSATITRGDESVCVRIASDPAPTLTAQKLQGLSSLWADAAQPDGRVLHAPPDAVAASDCEGASPVLRWTPVDDAAVVAGPSETERLRADMFGAIRHTLVAGQRYATPDAPEHDESKSQAERKRQQRSLDQPGKVGDALDAPSSLEREVTRQP